MKLIKLGMIRRGFDALFSESANLMPCKDDEIRQAAKQQALINCINLFASNPKFWDDVLVDEQMVFTTLGALLSVDGGLSDEGVKTALTLMMDSIPSFDYEPVKSKLILPGRGM